MAHNELEVKLKNKILHFPQSFTTLGTLQSAKSFITPPSNLSLSANLIMRNFYDLIQMDKNATVVRTKCRPEGLTTKDPLPNLMMLYQLRSTFTNISFDSYNYPVNQILLSFYVRTKIQKGYLTCPM